MMNNCEINIFFFMYNIIISIIILKFMKIYENMK